MLTYFAKIAWIKIDNVELAVIELQNEESVHAQLLRDEGLAFTT